MSWWSPREMAAATRRRRLVRGISATPTPIRRATAVGFRWSFSRDRLALIARQVIFFSRGDSRCGSWQQSWARPVHDRVRVQRARWRHTGSGRGAAAPGGKGRERRLRLSSGARSIPRDHRSRSSTQYRRDAFQRRNPCRRRERRTDSALATWRATSRRRTAAAPGHAMDDEEDPRSRRPGITDSVPAPTDRPPSGLLPEWRTDPDRRSQRVQEGVATGYSGMSEQVTRTARVLASRTGGGVPISSLDGCGRRNRRVHVIVSVSS